MIKKRRTLSIAYKIKVTLGVMKEKETTSELAQTYHRQPT
tara:strand:+ start:8147 stop:8266 length:120 start_codon:yes stop_codon:yes gene_type:complete